MTLTKDISAKFAVAIVAVAMIFSAYAPAAQAQSTEDLQQMINDLLAQVAALQSQLGGGNASTGDSLVSSQVCPYTWTRDLSQGSTGADVMKLQQFLNANPDTRVAADGAGSVGMETMFFGPATAAAVSKMQVMYRAEVLTPGGLVNPTGYFGPSTRAKANSLCVAAPVMEEEEEGEMTEEEEEEMDVTLRGEASLDDFQIDSAQDDDVEEGAEDAVIAEVTVEFDNGDAEISRMDVTIKQAGVDSWDVLESVSLWIDGDKVAEIDADRENDYLDEDDGTLRFTGLDIVAMEDEEVEILIAATFQNNVDNDDLGTFNVSVDTIRYFDADGVATTEDNVFELGDTVSFNLEEAGFEDELLVRTSSNDPDSATLQVEDDRKSGWFTVFVFDLDTDDSINDIELNTFTVNVVTTLATFDALVNDVELVIDGVTIDDYTVTGGGTNSASIEFDVDGDVVIDAGDRVKAELMLRFNSLATEGATVQASVPSINVTNVDAEGADDLENSQLSGAATGDVHTLRTAGAATEMTDDSAVVTTGDLALDDYATFEIEIEVTAFEQDVFISVDPAVSMGFDLVNGAGVSAVAGSRSVVLTSSADENGGYFEINEGQTETVTLTVTYTPGAANTAARLLLEDISFAETAVAPTQTQTTLPATDYRTAVVTIVN